MKKQKPIELTKEKFLFIIRREYLRGYIRNLNISKYTAGSLGFMYRKYLKDNPSVRREVSLLFPKKKK